MRDHPLARPPADRPVPARNDWLNELRDILFEGSGTSESRLEAFLDRVESRR
jgi:hypothetical protein